MLVALVFVLARNIVKLVVERRRALPFARFRAKLVALLLGMTLVPAVLVLIVGSELIRTSVDRWFNAPMDDILSVGEQDCGRLLPRAADARAATTPPRIARDAGGSRPRRHPMCGRFATCSRRTSRSSACRWSRSTESSPVGGIVAAPRAGLDVAAPALPAGYNRAAADRLAAQALAGAGRDRVGRSARHLGRSAACRSRHPCAGRPADRRGRRDRLSDRRSRGSRRAA